MKELDNIQKTGESLTQESDNATQLQTNHQKLLIGLKDIRVIGRRADIKDRIAGFKMLRGKRQCRYNECICSLYFKSFNST